MKEPTGERHSFALAGYRDTGLLWNIGGELLKQARRAEGPSLSREPDWVKTSKGVLIPSKTGLQPVEFDPFEDPERFPDVLFVATPSNIPDESYRMISEFLAADRIVITAEKGALSHYFDELREESDNFRYLGSRAVVGGGTRLIQGSKEFAIDPHNINEIHYVINGTVQFLSVAMSEGYTLHQAVLEASDNHYVEPNPDNTPLDSIEVVAGELTGDVPKKLVTVFNMLGLTDKLLTLEQVEYEITPEEIRKAMREAAHRRFIVSIYPEWYFEKHEFPEEDIVAPLIIPHKDWMIVMGFRNLNNNTTLKKFENLQRAGNGAVFILGGQTEGDGTYTTNMGPGAGRAATVNAMLDDHAHMLKRFHEEARLLRRAGVDIPNDSQFYRHIRFRDKEAA